jgi:hypothetical protein
MMLIRFHTIVIGTFAIFVDGSPGLPDLPPCAVSILLKRTAQAAMSEYTSLTMPEGLILHSRCTY